MVDIDAIDRKILIEMQRDCAVPVEELGARIGLSRNACWRRVKRLEAEGVIRGRVALADPEALGKPLQVFISVRTRDHDPDWLTKFTAAVRDVPEVVGAYRMTGELDYLIRARIGGIKDYDELYQRLISRVPMTDVSASFVMKELKETTALPVG